MIHRSLGFTVSILLTMIPSFALSDGVQTSSDIIASKIELLQKNRLLNGSGPKLFSDYSINDHANECVADVGMFNEFNCLDGQIIPITVNGEEVAPGQHTPNMKCDKPALLGLGDDGQCVPYSRVGILKNVGANDDVEWSFICRRYKIRDDPMFERFEDVAVVGYRRSTGASCFYQTLSVAKGLPDGIVATRVPSPAENDEDVPEGATPSSEFWLSPKDTAAIGCYTCHDSDPWVHTPYIDQVKNLENPLEAIVPAGPPVDLPLKYSFIGSEFFTNWPNPTYFAPRNNECTGCHRMGAWNSSSFFARHSTGGDLTNISEQFTQYPHTHWMPPLAEGSPETEALWDALYRASIEQLIQCRRSPHEPVCRQKEANQ